MVVAVAISMAEPAAAQGELPGLVTNSVNLDGRLHVAGAATAQRLTYWSRGPRGPMQSTGRYMCPTA